MKTTKTIMKTTKTMAPAKGGEIATHDIEVKAGDTPFKPGPVVGELQKAGIPAAIQEGKVVIKNDKVIVPAGEKIPVDVAQMLTRLEIHPIEIGMNLNAVFEDGSIFTPDVLDIDMDKFVSQLQQASSNAFSLAVETAWINKSSNGYTFPSVCFITYNPALCKFLYNLIIAGKNMSLKCTIDIRRPFFPAKSSPVTAASAPMFAAIRPSSEL